MSGVQLHPQTPAMARKHSSLSYNASYNAVSTAEPSSLELSRQVPPLLDQSKSQQ